MNYSLKSTGDWRKTFDFLERSQNINILLPRIVFNGAEEGKRALSSATPKDTGKAASRWDVEIEKGFGETNIYWTNDDTNKGYNIITLLQYGHGTGTGGYVNPRDFINPVMKRIYKGLADAVWKEVTK